MGTNFYLVTRHSRHHLGKRSCKEGNRYKFTWAVDPHFLGKVGRIKDEYGDAFTKEEFVKIVDDCEEQCFDMINMDFS